MIIRIFHIAGSLGLFLYGMRIMSDGIQKAAGERLHSVLNYMTINRFAAVLTGFSSNPLPQQQSWWSVS
jgi:phosphate:Na+ symporter